MTAATLKRKHDEISGVNDQCPQVPKLAQVSIDKSPPATNSDDDRDHVHSPNNVIEAHKTIAPSPLESKRSLCHTRKEEEMQEEDPMAEKRVTIWNWREQRKLSGNSAPFKKNLLEYIRKHPVRRSWHCSTTNASMTKDPTPQLKPSLSAASTTNRS